MMRWPGTKYYELQKGWSESFLMHENSEREIAYTEDGYVFVGTGYTQADENAVEEFADQYGCEIVWEGKR